VTSRNEHIGIERVARGDLTLTDWVPALTLTSGVLPKEVSEAAFPDRAWNRGLFAATQCRAPR